MLQQDAAERIAMTVMQASIHQERKPVMELTMIAAALSIITLPCRAMAIHVQTIYVKTARHIRRPLLRMSVVRRRATVTRQNIAQAPARFARRMRFNLRQQVAALLPAFAILRKNALVAALVVRLIRSKRLLLHADPLPEHVILQKHAQAKAQRVLRMRLNRQQQPAARREECVISQKHAQARAPHVQQTQNSLPALFAGQARAIAI